MYYYFGGGGHVLTGCLTFTVLTCWPTFQQKILSLLKGSQATLWFCYFVTAKKSLFFANFQRKNFVVILRFERKTWFLFWCFEKKVFCYLKRLEATTLFFKSFWAKKKKSLHIWSKNLSRNGKFFQHNPNFLKRKILCENSLR